MQIYWYKRDLRIVHNSALIEAIKGSSQYGPILFVYIHEPQTYESPIFSKRHQDFIDEAIDDLFIEIEKLGGMLLEIYDSAVGALTTLSQSLPFKRLISHQETSCAAEFERDNQVARWCLKHAIEWTQIPQNNVKRGGGQLQPFDQWFSTYSTTKIRDPRGTDLQRFLVSYEDTVHIQGSRPPQLQESTPCRPLVSATRRAAEETLTRFFSESIVDYPKNISNPIGALTHNSKLSAYLAYGLVSQEELAVRANLLVSDCVRDNHPSAKEIERAVRFFLDRLAWRQGMYAGAESFPAIEHQDHFKGFAQIDRDTDKYKKTLERFAAGQTGIPWIDAGMRCLQTHGYLNFRYRACLANFACMGLRLHWRDVGVVLGRLFLDFDNNIHWNQMRIASGSGIQETFLVYSVLKQQTDHDCNSRWIKMWLPEIKDVPGYIAQQIWAYKRSTLAAHGLILGRDYPEPICSNPEDAMRSGKSWVSELRGKPSEARVMLNKAKMTLGVPDATKSFEKIHGHQMGLF